MPSDDLDIRLQDSTPRQLPKGVPPDQDAGCGVEVLGKPNPALPPVYVSLAALRAMFAHGASYPERESGGVLLGRFLSGETHAFLLVEQIITGLMTEGTATRLTFTHDTWLHINATRDRDFPELQIVGWYHTHPNLGIFLSGDDQYIHRNFFHESWQIAMVIDPIAFQFGLFAWLGDRLQRDDGVRVYAQSDTRGELQPYVAALAEGRRAPAPRATDREVPPVNVEVVFPEMTVNLGRLMPAKIRGFFGIEEVRTAPRLSVKTLLIVVLAILLGFQAIRERQLARMLKQPPPAATVTEPAQKPAAPAQPSSGSSTPAPPSSTARPSPAPTTPAGSPGPAAPGNGAH